MFMLQAKKDISVISIKKKHKNRKKKINQGWSALTTTSWGSRPSNDANSINTLKFH